MSDFVEGPCTIELGGRKYTNFGAEIHKDRAIAYTDGKGTLTDWHGNKLGTYTVQNTWRMWTRYGYVKMRYITADIDGRLYYGKQGEMQLVRLKAFKNQPAKKPVESC